MIFEGREYLPGVGVTGAVATRGTCGEDWRTGEFGEEALGKADSVSAYQDLNFVLAKGKLRNSVCFL